MFVRVKPSGPYRYLQLVAHHREGRGTVQRVLATLGRVDQLAATGAVDGLLRSLGRFAEQVRVVDAHRRGQLEAGAVRQLGPDLVFGRLWRVIGLQAILTDLRRARHFEFPVERAVSLTVLHRLCESGSDRAAERWRRDVHIPGTDRLERHHLYRAVRWLGETKDAVEATLFQQRRDLFSELTLAFFETTRLDFEGQGGATVGRYGHSQDHRPDRRQLVVGAGLTGAGRPVCGELWPGSRADGRALLPVVDRLRARCGVRQVWWVADRGMSSARTLGEPEQRERPYILGARLRRQREVRQEILSRAGRSHEVADNLRVKDVWRAGRRYIVCHNPEEAAKDAAAREAILPALADQLRHGAKHLIGHRGVRRFLRISKAAVTIDQAKVAAEARDDGQVVLRTNPTLPAAEVAVPYKHRPRVEPCFRAAKSLLETRPIFQQWDATSRGHVFCSFLALVLVDALQRGLAARGWRLEWADLRRDLTALAAVEVRDGDHWSLLRPALQGVAGTGLQAVGVAVPPPVRSLPDVVPSPAATRVTPCISSTSLSEL
jgi:Transposase DDE domain